MMSCTMTSLLNYDIDISIFKQQVESIVDASVAVFTPTLSTREHTSHLSFANFLRRHIDMVEF